MLHTLLLIIQLFCAAAIVALVLLQRGKGAEAGAGFGSGASGTVFGARGATTALSRTTAILAAVFMLTSLSLSYISTRASTSPSSSNSLLDRMAQPTAPAHTAPAGVAGSGATGVAAAPAAPATGATTPASTPAPKP
jgi:preprotein translocase subunit SecG